MIPISGGSSLTNQKKIRMEVYNSEITAFSDAKKYLLAHVFELYFFTGTYQIQTKSSLSSESLLLWFNLFSCVQMEIDIGTTPGRVPLLLQKVAKATFFKWDILCLYSIVILFYSSMANISQEARGWGIHCANMSVLVSGRQVWGANTHPV